MRELLVGQVKQRYVEYIYMEIMERIDMFKLIFISFVVLIVASAPESTIAQEGTWVHIPPNLPHSILATTKVLMLLTLTL